MMRQRVGAALTDEGTLERLAKLLTAQCGVLRELVSVAARQKQALLEGDQPGVEAATKEQNELLAELQRLEAERLALLRAGAVQEAEGGDEAVAETVAEAVTLEEIISGAPAEDARRLSGLRDEARSLVDELSALNETNAQLLKQELALIELYMSILSPEAGAEVYGDPARGRRPAGGASVAFDTRA